MVIAWNEMRKNRFSSQISQTVCLAFGFAYDDAIACLFVCLFVFRLLVGIKTN